ncbi:MULTISPECIES: orotate phosphoribosyltransferase [Bacillaceae]|uniref:Orotate phosphoribosyltransferase n=1 Tax=Evansella alkalicola TaxID=745819 RepID=A0ABS6JQ69_9BACI|nr:MULTISPECIES: orotate phosphoribosyltransferase [Bacillaceae]MBU9720412.1 orotate phosphoribosyltransferase [Bacillus alkalicola]
MSSAKIASALLSIGAVSLRPQDPFRWSSGLKSPIYCDNRLTMSYPEIRNEIIDQFVELIKREYPEVEIIAGTATAGIPHAAWVADRLDLPMIYVRSKAKGHGKGNMIEGLLEEGKKVVVIEDLISTGGSSIQAANAVTESGGNVLGISAIFTYELNKGKQAFEAEKLTYHSLTTFSVLLEEALKNGGIDHSGLKLLERWREDPQNWSI